jgi:hypothetical protein
MSTLGIFGRAPLPLDPPERNEQVVVQKVLHHVLAFTGHSIDDVVNDPIVKRKVLGFYKLHNWVSRESEISSLERQWNTVPRTRN